MKTNFAVLISKNIYCYQLIGMEYRILFNVFNRFIIIAETETGAPLKIIPIENDLTFDEFVSVAKDMWMTIINKSGGSLISDETIFQIESVCNKDNFNQN